MYGPSVWQLTTDHWQLFFKDHQPSGSSAGHPETLSLTRPVYRLARRCQDYEGTCTIPGSSGEQKDLRLFPAAKATPANRRSLDSGQPAHQAKSRLDAFLGWPSLGMTLQTAW